MSEQPLERIRQLCLALPGVEERLSHGEPAWFIQKGRLFAMFADRHHDNRVACWVASDHAVQQANLQKDPLRYFRPPYVGVKGWIGIYLDVDVDWEEAAALIREGYEQVKPTPRKPS